MMLYLYIARYGRYNRNTADTVQFTELQQERQKYRLLVATTYINIIKSYLEINKLNGHQIGFW